MLLQSKQQIMSGRFLSLPSRRKKILCLHGYSMNGEWMQEWMEPLQELLGDAVELICPQGPVACPEDEVRKVWGGLGTSLPGRRIGEGKNWCWYRATDDVPPRYLYVDDALSCLTGLFEQHGPIDGVIGWSQGATLAALLVGEMLVEQESHFQFNWVVLGAGSIPADRRFEKYFGQQFDFPSLHIIGEKESLFMKQRSEALYKRFENGQCLNPPVGHVWPLKYPEVIENIANWIWEIT